MASTSKNKSKSKKAKPDPVVVSGMRPTGTLHLGHLNGAIKSWVRLQDEASCYFFVADWHALTTEYANTDGIAGNVDGMVLDWLAAGMDPERSVLFLQSEVPAHAELFLMYSMVIPVPWLERVPTYKEQQEQLEGRDLSTMGFLGYPLLQAADITAYKATAVPVGEDQLPHIELTREVVRRFNRLYGEIFPEPKSVIVPAARVPGTDGRKMSKSYGNSVDLTDDPAAIEKKLSRMVTDTRRQRLIDPGDPKDCPAFRLHEIYCTEEERAELTVACKTASIGCLDCKKVMIKHVVAEVEPMRQRRLEFEKRPGVVTEILAEGGRRAREVADATLAEAKEAMGL
jgi:tryptophanyl-tRNA synthetase